MVIAWFQWETFEKTDKTLKATLELQRAYVALSTPITLPNQVGAAKIMHIPANWVNNGDTQTIVMFRGGCDSDEKGIFNFSEDYPPRQWVLGPKSAIPYISCHATVELIKAFRDKQLPLYIFGQAKYLDVVTENMRVTQFCMEVTPIVGDQATNSLSAQIIACKDHNCTDKECDIYKPFP